MICFPKLPSQPVASKVLISSILLPLFIATTFFVLQFNSTDAAANNHKNNNTCNERAFEDAVKTLIMFGDKGFVFPTSSKSMSRRCKIVKSAETTSKDYINKCLKGEHKSISKVTVYSVVKANTNICKNANKKAAFLSLGSCLNRHRAEFNRIIIKLNKLFYAVKVYPVSKEKIPLLCCNYFIFKQLVLEKLTDCTETEVAGTEQLIETFSADGINLICDSGSESSDQCDRLLKKLPNYEKYPSNRIFFLTATDIMQSL